MFKVDNNTAEFYGNNIKFTRLPNDKEYTVQYTISDKAGNEVMSEKKVTLKEMPDVESNLTFGNVEWENGNAKLAVTKSETVTDDIKIQYSIGNETDWKDIDNNTYITDIENGSTVYVRLTDKTNNTESISTTINDKTNPTVELSIDELTTNSIKISVEAEDKETGLKNDLAYTYYIKESTEQDYKKDGNSSAEKTHTFTNLKAQTSYDIKVEVEDKAGNVGAKEITQSTDNIPPAEGNVEFGYVSWSEGTASTTVYTTTSYSIKYRVNEDTEWKDVENGKISGLKYDDTVYAVLAQGDIVGTPTSKVIKDDYITPTATVELNKNYAITDEQVTATVALTDKESGIDSSNCKWVLNTTKSNIGTINVSSYTNDFNSANSDINLTKTTMYDEYLHILATDKAGNKQEIIKRIPGYIKTNERYIGYYADFEGDGTVDGVIYADFAFGSSGNWNSDKWSNYSYNKKDNLKNYYIKSESYNGKFGTKAVITPVDEVAETENDRFYVMALENVSVGSTKSFSWYYNAQDLDINRSVAYTGNDFGSGKKNTIAMIDDWNNNTSIYGEQYEKDLWGIIQNREDFDIVESVEDSKKWFVPSKSEWSAFGKNLGLTSWNYYSKGLLNSYWSSSQYVSAVSNHAYLANYNASSGRILTSSVAYFSAVRLSASY